MSGATHDSSKTPEAALAEHAADFPAAEIPEGVLSYTADLFLDTVGCIFGGSGADGVGETLATLQRWGGANQASVIPQRIKTNAPNAAFANSVMAHARDYDDTHDEAVLHGCVTAVPALMGACQLREKPTPGREFLAALAVGLDISNRLSLSLISYLHVGWLPTTVLGAFGATCAVGRLLGLDAVGMRNAMGFAYAQVGGNRQALIDGTLAKRMQPAFAAVIAVQSAAFAQAGLTAADRFLTGDYGLPALYTGGRIDHDRLTDDLAIRWETANISVKPYPSCRCSHPVIDAALELRDGIEDPAGQIEAGTILLPPTSMGQIGYPFRLRRNPTVDAQFSAQYTAALALVSGRPRLRDFEVGTIRGNTQVLDLADRFEAQERRDGTAGLTPVEIVVRLRAGGERRVRVEVPSGHPAKPLSPDQLSDKLDDNLSYSLRKPDVGERRRIAELLASVGDSADVAELIVAL